MESTHNGWRIVRYADAAGTNLAIQAQPVIRLYAPNQSGAMLLGRWTTLCLPGGAVNALEATDAQIVEAIAGDESVF